jgi:two-component system, OmpR family, sensor histidine kinase KdpD
MASDSTCGSPPCSAAAAVRRTDVGRGELRIYLGAAPGVGKTYAMLCEAHRRAERGTDVVVGLVETHGRAKTATMVEGLEVVARRTVSYRGVELTELDVDAVIARAPRVVLVDELAHTNAPGSRHAKRWQDVEDLLEAGITVLSTVNIQHLESLNDVIERITGVRQQETVPDEVVRRAQQVELVDITPEALRRRMAHGNVYAPEKVDAAMANYFQPRNLTALREMALLWLADQVEVALQRYRADQQVTDIWETRERVVVALTGGPESETVLRRAARIAERSGSAELFAVHVLRGDGLAGAPVGAVAGLRRLAGSVGASFHTVVGDHVPTALLEFARGVDATQLVIGTSRRSRLARVLVESIGARVVHDSGHIDVHMVTHPEAGRGIRLPRRLSAVPAARRAAGWALSLLLPLTAAGVGVLGSGLLGLSTDVVLFFLATVVAALVGGLGPALLAAVACGLLLNYFLTPPLYTFTISERENVITLVAMVLVAVLVALVVDRAARRAQQAAQARAEAALLASFSRTVLARSDPLPRLLEKIREAFALTSVAILQRRENSWTVSACAGPPDCTRPEQADVDVAVDPDTHLVGTGRTVTDPATTRPPRTVTAPHRIKGEAAALRRTVTDPATTRRILTAADRRLLDAVAGQALLALRNQQVSAEAAEAKRRADATELRSALLSAVGHDLRTPLTSIKAAAGSLRDEDLRLSEADRTELAATIEESADRLTGVVNNLLDSSRIATGAVTPDLEAVGYDEIAVLALRGLDGADRVRLDVPDDLPEVLADPGLLERVIANLVDNALRHGGGSPVTVRGSAYEGRVELRVVDSGPGVPRGHADRLFAPFQRLGDREPRGLGLGLSVARGFTDAMGGVLTAEDTPGGGLTMTVSLPAAARPSAAVPADAPAELAP